MKTIAIDTSVAIGSVAALDPSAAPPRRAERVLGQPGDHARLLTPALGAVTAELGWPIRDAELVAVVRGPGSFTGLRVGVATAKAICWASGARLVGVSGFEAVAARTAAATGDLHGAVFVAYDAGRGDVFAARVARDPHPPTGWSIGPAELAPAEAWLDRLSAGALVSGPALETLASAAVRRGLVVAPREAWLPSAAVAASLALARAAAGEADDPHTLVPAYSRPSYADEKSPRSSG